MKTMKDKVMSSEIDGVVISCDGSKSTQPFTAAG